MALPHPLKGLADVDPLAVSSDDVGLVGVDGIGARAATHEVFDGGDVPGLEEVVSTPTVEVVRRSIAALTDQVVRSAAAVDGVLPVPVAELIPTLTALDEVGAAATVELVAAAERISVLSVPVIEFS
jgi:hypothetical protein